MDLCGKVAVITGGKRIGRVVAQELAQRGMNLVLSYRGSKEEADQTVVDVEGAGRRATTVSGDVSQGCAAHSSVWRSLECRPLTHAPS